MKMTGSLDSDQTDSPPRHVPPLYACPSRSRHLCNHDLCTPEFHFHAALLKLTKAVF